MAVRYLLGNEGIAHACLEANIDFASGYPGTPSSEVIDVLRVQKERPFTVDVVRELRATNRCLMSPLGDRIHDDLLSTWHRELLRSPGEHRHDATSKP